MHSLMQRYLLVVLAFAIFPTSLSADTEVPDEQQAFVEANILSIFYHELGHAVIDLLQVPIYGQEEDAADVMAVMLINNLFEEESAQSIAYDSGFGFINDPQQTEEVAYWDLHGPDEQRFYNHVCLFYGANPEQRQGLAEDLQLPRERADTCMEEFAQADASWSAIFDEMTSLQSADSLIFTKGSGKTTATLNRLLALEVDNINAEFGLPEEVEVIVDSCGEANAFYDPQVVSITFCSEFVPHLESLFQSNFIE